MITTATVLYLHQYPISFTSVHVHIHVELVGSVVVEVVQMLQAKEKINSKNYRRTCCTLPAFVF
jgi:hypothetical protein